MLTFLEEKMGGNSLLKILNIPFHRHLDASVFVCSMPSFTKIRSSVNFDPLKILSKGLIILEPFFQNYVM